MTCHGTLSGSRSQSPGRATHGGAPSDVAAPHRADGDGHSRFGAAGASLRASTPGRCTCACVARLGGSSGERENSAAPCSRQPLHCYVGAARIGPAEGLSVRHERQSFVLRLTVRRGQDHRRDTDPGCQQDGWHVTEGARGPARRTHHGSRQCHAAVARAIARRDERTA
jgi:hypothetical protein